MGAGSDNGNSAGKPPSPQDEDDQGARLEDDVPFSVAVGFLGPVAAFAVVFFEKRRQYFWPLLLYTVVVPVVTIAVILIVARLA
jgi:hypothetical protein